MQNNDQWSRRSILLGTTWIAAAGLAAPLLSSCAGPSAVGAGAGGTLDALKKQGFINVGVYGSQVYGYTDNSGRVTGEAPEVARAVFAKLGVPEIKATQVTFDQLIPALNARQFDMICAGMYITPARCNSVLFSRPDLMQRDRLLVPKGNPLNVNNLSDVAGKNVKIGIAPGTAEVGYALAAGVKQDQIMTFDQDQAMLDSVISGRIYTAIMTDLGMKALLKSNPNAPVEMTSTLEFIVNGKPARIGAGFVFRKDQQDLVDEFNRELTVIQDNGEWLKITEPFGFTKEYLPPKDLTTEQLCSES